MTCYVALLRGINTSGHRIVKMAQIKSIFESLHLTEVQTYIQSGNVPFVAEETSVALLKARIESQLETALGYPIAVILRTAEEFEYVVRSSPFPRWNETPDRVLYVTFLAAAPSAIALEDVRSRVSEPVHAEVHSCEVYWSVPSGHVKTPWSNNYLENKLAVPATTRNWNTVVKIADLLRRRSAPGT